MNQPDVGLKVSELRQLNYLTQEQPTEKREVRTHTIQSAESSELNQRAYTFRRLGDVHNLVFEGHKPTTPKIWLTVLHFNSAIGIPIILVVWFWKKDMSARIYTQERQVLNFLIIMILPLFAAASILVELPVGMIILDEVEIINLNGCLLCIQLSVCPTLPLVVIGLVCTYHAIVKAARAIQTTTTTTCSSSHSCKWQTCWWKDKSSTSTALPD